MATQIIATPHILYAEEVCGYYNVSPTSGLTTHQVEVNRARFGLNELQHEEGKSVLTLLLEQFQDLLARILLAAALVSFVLAVVSGEEEGLTAFIEPLVILLILVANAIVSVWQESSAEKSLEALKRLQPELARVLRDGVWKTVASQELVPGDIVEVRVGDKVPADLRIVQLKTVSLRAEQSMLTGEAQTVPKEATALPPAEAKCEIQSKINMLFASTTIANGAAIAVVTATAMSTELGAVHLAVQDAGAEQEQTPLQQKLDEFGELLSKIIGLVCVLVWIINYKNFSDPSHGGVLRGCIYYFKTAVALAVAAIPEGLTAVITTCLALGTRKMAQKNAIVRRLPSVETLGCTTVICSDKTGTLTTNEMSVVRFSLPRSPTQTMCYRVEGHSYQPVGRAYLLPQNSTAKSWSSPTRRGRSGGEDYGTEFIHIGRDDHGLQQFVRCAAMCNEAQLAVNKSGRVIRHGEPTEAALKVLVEKLGCPDQNLNKLHLQVEHRKVAEAYNQYWCSGIQKLAVLDFSRERKSMSVICRERNVSPFNVLYVKGAPEAILARSTAMLLPDGTVVPLNEEAKRGLANELESMASAALRTLALAAKFDLGDLRDYNGPNHPQHKMLADSGNFARIETNLIFLGMVGIVDPPRPEVSHAIRMCNVAGIRVVMITGDNKKTAEAIAVRIGILPEETSAESVSSGPPRISLTGREFEELPEREKYEVLRGPFGSVFSRTEPKHKQMIIKILKELGEITAMTGDGVNDAPALKQADIGIAMGITGTEVAKEASDMILADDNFQSIVLAVEEGRSIYNNMKAFIRYLISSNIGEVASIFLTAALGIPEGLAPVQLLWVNLVTDGLPATALGFNPPDVDVMTRPPRKRDDPLISGWVFFRYVVIGMYVGLATVGIFIWWYVYGVDPADGHTLVSFWELSHWGQCHNWPGFAVNTVYDMTPADPCSYFRQGRIKASTLSLTVLVIIEMFNAFNALSEDGSLLQLPPWSNIWLVLAVTGSVLVHCAILYIPPLASIFGVVPLSLHDWIWVVIWSFPVLVIDEVLKAYARSAREKERALNTRFRPKKLE